MALQSSYKKKGLCFNETKTEFLVFNRKGSVPAPEVKLWNKIIKSSTSIEHIGLPVGCNVKSNRLLLIYGSTSKVRKA